MINRQFAPPTHHVESSFSMHEYGGHPSTPYAHASPVDHAGTGTYHSGFSEAGRLEASVAQIYQHSRDPELRETAGGILQSLTDHRAHAVDDARALTQHVIIPGQPQHQNSPRHSGDTNSTHVIDMQPPTQIISPDTTRPMPPVSGIRRQSSGYAARDRFDTPPAQRTPGWYTRYQNGPQ